MGILDIFRRSEPVETKASAAGSIMAPWYVGLPVWPKRDFESLAETTYIQNAVGYKCVKLIATCAASAAIQLQRKDGQLVDSDHPLLRLINRPSPFHGGSFLFESLYTYLLLSGNAYLESVGPTNKPPMELWSLRSDRMRVIPSRFGTPQAYRYENAGMKKDWIVDPITGQSEILHIREFHPTDDHYGLSRSEPALFGLARHNAASAHNKALLDNGARPSGALVFEPVEVPGSTSLSAPPEILEKAEEELLKRHSGPNNAGRPMVLGGKIKWEEMGLSPKDMDFDANKRDAARDICTALGVPFILVVQGDATYNNMKEAKLQLYEETVLPLLDRGMDELNNWLTPRFGDDLTLATDLDSIPALEERRQTKRSSVSKLMDDGVLDADEAREELGYGPRRDSTVRKVDGAVLTALINAARTVGMTPLYRYMLSVGLIEPGTSEEDLMEQALSLLEDDDNEAGDTADQESDDVQD